MSGLALFVGSRRPSARRVLGPGACPLCGRPMEVTGTLWAPLPARGGCRLGSCAADPEPGTDAHTLVEANRAVLRDELVEVEFSYAALGAAIDLAIARGRDVAPYAEQRFPLALRRRILRSYVG